MLERQEWFTHRQERIVQYKLFGFNIYRQQILIVSDIGMDALLQMMPGYSQKSADRYIELYKETQARVERFKAQAEADTLKNPQPD